MPTPSISFRPDLRPRAFCEWGIFKSFVRFSILRTIPLLDLNWCKKSPSPTENFWPQQCCWRACFWNTSNALKVNNLCQIGKSCISKKKKNAPALLLGWMMLIIIKTKSKSKGFLLHLIGPFFWINCGSSRVLHVWYKATYIYSKPGYSPNF